MVTRMRLRLPCMHQQSTLVSMIRHGSSAPKIPIPTSMNPPHYALPAGSPEAAGGANKDYIASLPQFKEVIREAVYLPPRDDLWKANSSSALDRIAKHASYFDLSRYALEHGFFHLFYDMLVAPDAPLPHVMYEDFLRVKMFGSMQDVPEKQFSLEPALLRGLLCLAAHHLILDKGYFQTSQMLFRRMDKEQSVGREVLSAWIFCCTAAGEVESALSFATYLDVHKIPLDPTVFSLMMHPSVNPNALVQRSLLHEAKGMLQQQRMHHRLAAAGNSTSGVAVHGMFVFYALTLNHVRKWELVRLAAMRSIALSGRTLALVMHAFRTEKGKLCGPKTCKLVLKALLESELESDQLANALYVLIRMRKNELLPDMQGFDAAQFSSEECELVMTGLRWQGRHRDVATMRAVLPIADALVRHSKPAEVAQALSECTLSLQTLFSRELTNKKAKMEGDAPLISEADVSEVRPSSSVVAAAEDNAARPDAGDADNARQLSALPSAGEELLAQVFSDLAKTGSNQLRKRKNNRRRVKRATEGMERGGGEVAVIPAVDPLDVPALVKSLASSADVQALQYAQRLAEEEKQLASLAALKLPSAWISMD